MHAVFFHRIGQGSQMATNYSKDGTYWTARERSNGYLEVVRIKAGGDYAVVESWAPTRSEVLP